MERKKTSSKRNGLGSPQNSGSQLKGTMKHSPDAIFLWGGRLENWRSIYWWLPDRTGGFLPTVRLQYA